MMNYQSLIQFNCNGDWRKEKLEFSPTGFFKSYQINMDKINHGNVNDVILYGKKYEFWRALLTESEWLFEMSRQTIMDLEELCREPLYQQEYSKADISNVNESASRLRTNLISFLHYIDYFMSLCLKDKCIEIEQMKGVFPIEAKLNNLKNDFVYLAEHTCHEEILLSSADGCENGFKVSDVNYHIVHCYYDFQYYYILIKSKFCDLKSKWSFLPTTPEKTPNDVDYFLLLMSDLLLRNIIKFKWTEHYNIIDSVMTCPCVKEFWVLLYSHLGLDSFWNYLNEIQGALLNIKTPEKQILKSLCNLSLHYMNGVTCLVQESTIHFLNMLSKLNEHIQCKDEWFFSGLHFFPCVSNIKCYFESDPPEVSLRRTLRAISSIMDNWDVGRERILVLIWEHCYKMINVSLDVTGVPCSRFSSTIMSGKHYLEDIKKRFSSEWLPDENENSFGLFLWMIAFHIPKNRSAPSKMLYFYKHIAFKYNLESEKSRKIIEEYNEIGLQRVSSIFLTCAIAYDIKAGTKRLCDIISTRESDTLPSTLKAVKYTTLVACLLLLAENGYDIEDVATIIVREIEIAIRKKSTNVLSILVEGINILIENRNNYMSAVPMICLFIKDWIGSFCSISAERETGSLLAIFNPLLEDLKNGAEWWSADEMGMLEKQLLCHILPVISNHLYATTAKTAALFLSYLIMRKNTSLSYSLCDTWLRNGYHSMKSRKKFIVYFYEIEGDAVKLSKCIPNGDLYIVQTFLHEQIFYPEARGSYTLMRIVLSMPKILHYMEDICQSGLEDDYPIDGFIRMFGIILKRNLTQTAKADIKHLFNMCFAKFNSWIDLALSRNKMDSVISNIYRCSGLIVSECYSIIYESNNPQCLLKAISDKIFLPIEKASNMYNLPLHINTLINEHMDLFLRGLLKLNKIDATVKNILMKVLDFCFPLEPFTSAEFYQNHPIYKCLIDTEFTKYLAVLLQEVFLVKWHEREDAQVANFIRLISFITIPVVCDQVFSSIIYQLLTFIMETNNPASVKESILSYLKACTNSSLGCRLSFMSNLERITEAELLAGSVRLNKLLRCVVKVCPKQVDEVFPIVKRLLDHAEKENNRNQLAYLKAFKMSLKDIILHD